MNKTIILFFLFFGLFCIQSFVSGQSIDSLKYKNEIRFGILSIYTYTLQFNYERILNDKNSLVGICQLSHITVKGNKDFSTAYGFSYRYYLLNFIKDNEDRKYWKAYISPGLKYSNYQLYTKEYQYINSQSIEKEYHDVINSFDGNFVFGLHHNTAKIAIIDFNLGIAYRYSIISTKRVSHTYGYKYSRPGYSGLAPIANFTIGFKF